MKLVDWQVDQAIRQHGTISIKDLNNPSWCPELGKEITGVTVDVRLDNKFKRMNKTIGQHALEVVIDQTDVNSQYAEEIVKDDIVIYPGELLLAITLEHVSLAPMVMARLDGKSTLARKGILVHLTADRIDPGWDGKIVLEILNVGRNPVRLHSGHHIAALEFELLDEAPKYPYTQRENASYKNQSNIVTPEGGSRGY